MKSCRQLHATLGKQRFLEKKDDLAQKDIDGKKFQYIGLSSSSTGIVE